MLKQRNKLIDNPFMVVGILMIGVIVCIGLFYIGSFVFAMTVFVSDILFSQKHTYTDDTENDQNWYCTKCGFARVRNTWLETATDPNTPDEKERGR